MDKRLLTVNSSSYKAVSKILGISTLAPIFRIKFRLEIFLSGTFIPPLLALNNSLYCSLGTKSILSSSVSSSADIYNPGYFPPILGLFWAILDYLRLDPGYLPPMHRHIVMYCRCPMVVVAVVGYWGIVNMVVMRLLLLLILKVTHTHTSHP